jgi:hypothetical protein
MTLSLSNRGHPATIRKHLSASMVPFLKKPQLSLLRVYEWASTQLARIPPLAKQDDAGVWRLKAGGGNSLAIKDDYLVYPIAL